MPQISITNIGKVHRYPSQITIKETCHRYLSQLWGNPRNMTTPAYTLCYKSIYPSSSSYFASSSSSSYTSIVLHLQFKHRKYLIDENCIRLQLKNILFLLHLLLLLPHLLLLNQDVIPHFLKSRTKTVPSLALAPTLSPRLFQQTCNKISN